MSDKYKERVRRSVAGYLAKQEKRAKGPKRKNGSPEKVVARECLEWMRSLGWDVDIYEAKATYDPIKGIYRSQGMKAGTCDCMGTMTNGVMVAVEFKAPGKLSTFNQDRNYKQKEFIVKKIDMNAFACVVDGAERLKSIYFDWCRHLLNGGSVTAKDYLHSMLP